MQVLVTLNSGQGVNLGPNFTLSANTGTIRCNMDMVQLVIVEYLAKI
jgi:hypothetical protein